mgnify:CR=1 FL=1
MSNSKINSQIEYFNSIFNEEADFVSYLDISEVVIAIKSEFGNKDIDQLLIKEKEPKPARTRELNTTLIRSLIKLFNELRISRISSK